MNEQLLAAIRCLGDKPSDKASREDKKRYSERLSECVAIVLGEELRARGMKEARPAGPGALDNSGAERRMGGGLGAKKVDVTWATEESGLLLAISIKSINFRDSKTKNFQKNLMNRRGDLLIEAVTLHRRFPYAVLSAFFFLDAGAEQDGTGRRKSTFLNAHARFKLFTGRNDPAAREEQFERFYIILLDAASETEPLRITEVGKPNDPKTLDEVLNDLLDLVGQRNPDFYEFNEDDGKLYTVT